MSVLSSDVNQLEDVVADSSTSIIRIIVFPYRFLYSCLDVMETRCSAIWPTYFDSSVGLLVLNSCST